MKAYLRIIAFGVAIYALALILVPPAHADWSFGPHVKRPGPHIGRSHCIGGALIRWCPDKKRKSRRSRRKHGGLNLESVNPSRKHRTRCRRLRVKYIREHPIHPPRELRFVHGCRRWVLDARFHRNDNNPLGDVLSRLRGV